METGRVTFVDWHRLVLLQLLKDTHGEHWYIDEITQTDSPVEHEGEMIDFTEEINKITYNEFYKK